MYWCAGAGLLVLVLVLVCLCWCAGAGAGVLVLVLVVTFPHEHCREATYGEAQGEKLAVPRQGQHRGEQLGGRRGAKGW